MSDEPFDWQEFLGRWRAEWVPDLDEELEDDEDEDHGPAGDPLGCPGADEAAITAAEERLGRRLPPSYREFLAVSDGWRVNQTAGVYRLGGVAEIDWFQDPHGMTPLYEQELGDDPREEDVLLAGMWRRALRLETDSDMSNALLDPGDSDEDGEWALYVYKGWSGELPERYPSFRAYMEKMYRGFHSDRAQSADFVNATTRAQDARVEEARLLALRGRYEEALLLLEEAMSFGRPHSRVLLNQLRHLSNPRVPQDYGILVADPRYLTEILPVQALEASAHGGRLSEEDHWLGMMAARGVDRNTAGTALRTMVDGTYRYAPGGAWGRAVTEARESARWGATDTAWRALRDALPLWQAPGPSLIAPIGLLADPVLGPLVTPERGREILATPRSGETGPAPGPVPDLDPPGLAWLTEPTVNRQPFQGYRCVWVEGVAPDRLPALIGEEGAELSAPTDPRMVSWHAPRRPEREGVQPWEDRAVVAVGRTAEAWSFAFDGHSDRHLNRRFLSPARAASGSGRAVVVWRDPRASSPGGPPASFHLSVAERGEELYAFTVRGTEIQRSGAIPDALDPANWCSSDGAELEWEAHLLAALHSELGLSLPRFALTRGRLSTFTTRSWTRAPQAGESFAYATVGFVRHRS
ncbi:SMI1/KNR4 family protein [Streptomyces sp. NPDC002553]|uniref:SMI1/KNR4 family protein n=1 Tax=Streptomyces sp. NPDC002553 TaxID=3154417 RepID=UPI00332B4588